MVKLTVRFDKGLASYAYEWFATQLFCQIGCSRQVVGVHMGLEYPSDLPAISPDFIDQHIGMGRFVRPAAASKSKMESIIVTAF